MWTLSMFFPFPYLSLLPIPVTISTQTKDPWFFNCLCLVISVFPEELSRIPGHLAWDTEGWPHLHTPSSKICTYCFVSPWLLLSKSPRIPEQNIWIWSRVEKITQKGKPEKQWERQIRKFGIPSNLDPPGFVVQYWLWQCQGQEERWIFFLQS